MQHHSTIPWPEMRGCEKVSGVACTLVPTPGRACSGALGAGGTMAQHSAAVGGGCSGAVGPHSRWAAGRGHRRTFVCRVNGGAADFLPLPVHQHPCNLAPVLFFCQVLCQDAAEGHCSQGCEGHHSGSWLKHSHSTGWDPGLRGGMQHWDQRQQECRPQGGHMRQRGGEASNMASTHCSIWQVSWASAEPSSTSYQHKGAGWGDSKPQ